MRDRIDAAVVGERVRALLLIRDEAGRVLVVPAGEGFALPGGFLGEAASARRAARAGAEVALGAMVAAGRPLLVTLAEQAGLCVIFEGTLDLAPSPQQLRFVDASDAPAHARIALDALAQGRPIYQEQLWWNPGPPRGSFSQPAPSLGRLFSAWIDADIAMWALGVALRAFPDSASFSSVRGMFWDAEDPSADLVKALHRTLTALTDAGVLDDDEGGGAEFRWNPTMDVRTDADTAG